MVYVSTHAEGVTRVLCFSDTRDQYSREAHAEDAAGLARLLRRLDTQLQVPCPSHHFGSADACCYRVLFLRC